MSVSKFDPAYWPERKVSAISPEGVKIRELTLSLDASKGALSEFREIWKVGP